MSSARPLTWVSLCACVGTAVFSFFCFASGTLAQAAALVSIAALVGCVLFRLKGCSMLSKCSLVIAVLVGAAAGMMEGWLDHPALYAGFAILYLVFCAGYFAFSNVTYCKGVTFAEAVIENIEVGAGCVALYVFFLKMLETGWTT